MSLSLMCGVVCVGSALGQGPNATQNGPMSITAKATIDKITVKGRARTLTITTTEGNEFTIPLSNRVKFEVRAPGDEGFVRAGQMLMAQGVLTNDRLFTKNVEIVLLPKGKKPQPGRMEKSTREVGASVNTYDVSGPIVAAEQDPNYEKYLAVAVRTLGQGAVLMLESGFKVTVVSDDIELIKEGMEAEVEALPGPGGRPVFLRVTVDLPDAMKSADLLGPAEPAK
ncbi:MAG: hypothetical protein KDA58_14810 [Planctomycetaceae bacterium]|nr:hypothetical protein [Planctomycetaceae bacterium]